MTISVTFDDSLFIKELNNIIKYSEGFLQGVENGKHNFLENLGKDVIQSLKDFIDSMARVDPKMYHHIYEWYQAGNSNARLFDVTYENSSNGLSLNYTFSQSKSIQSGSNEPFYDKAKIMEEGTPVKIVPKNSNALRFVVNGQEVFTQKPVVVTDPGGPLVKDAFKHVVETFFNNYFSQSFLKSSGIEEYLGNPLAFKTNLKSAKNGGKIAGEMIGYNWISNAGGKL
jgi:hypothetical protein